MKMKTQINCSLFIYLHLAVFHWKSVSPAFVLCVKYNFSPLLIKHNANDV
jgi:hypothetical protein